MDIDEELKKFNGPIIDRIDGDEDEDWTEYDQWKSERVPDQKLADFLENKIDNIRVMNKLIPKIKKKANEISIQEIDIENNKDVNILKDVDRLS